MSSSAFVVAVCPHRPGRLLASEPACGDVMQVRLFGEIRVDDGGVPLAICGVKQRTVMAALALAPGQPLSADQLIAVLWREVPVAHSGNALQAQIGQLRRMLGTDSIRTTAAGYALDIDPDEVTSSGSNGW